ncbi:MAG TPA: hypothetical protein VFG77_02405 [Nitrososphaeraceae archaeon]|nr:hypothetical protein [Nitrososphaeraceae archaeon]
MLVGDDGDDTIEGQDGGDSISGSARRDILNGNEGNDYIRHSDYSEGISPDGAADEIICGPGDDGATISNEEDVVTANCETIYPR